MVDLLLNVVLIAKENTSISFLRALNSVLNQVYSFIKILVVDTNEPNSMYSLGLQEDLAAFVNVEYLQLDQSLSIAAIRNIVLHHAEGDYIAFLYSNDVWDSTKALLQLDQLKENPEAVASCSNGLLIDERKKDVTVEPLIEHVTFDAAKWILDNPAKMSAQVIYKTAAIRQAGGFDEQFENFCDGDLLLRLSKKNKVLILPVFLCECYIAADNEDYDLHNLRDHQRILYKYMDLFLINKRMAQMFYARMICLAKINYLWLNLFLYIFMYFLKSPGRSFLLLLMKIGQVFQNAFKWIHRELSLLKEGIRISKDIHLLRKGKLWKGKTLKPVTAAENKEIPLSFSSARQYNEQNSLKFVFDHKLKSIVIPDYVTVIKSCMFFGCDQLISVELPNTVLEIQAHAFHKCKNLRRVSIQEGSRLGKIGAYAFACCSSLETMSLPSGLVQIGKSAFFECSFLKQLLFTNMIRDKERTNSVFPTALRKLMSYTFAGCSNLLTVEFGVNSMLETVENGAFMGCGKLQRVVLTGGIKALGSYTFAHCKELETVAIPQIDRLESIGKCAFMNCRLLDHFQLPNKIDRINIRTFYGCSSLKFVKIPKKVLAINHQAFAKCTALVTATVLTGDITISPTAFEKTTEVRIQENVTQETSTTI